jgi:hypothetical protein
MAFSISIMGLFFNLRDVYSIARRSYTISTRPPNKAMRQFGLGQETPIAATWLMQLRFHGDDP